MESKLKLKINKDKSAVERPWKRKFLGFTLNLMFGKAYSSISKQSLKRHKEKLKDILKYYNEEENYSIAKASAEVVMDNYGGKTRVKEIVDFCKQMKYKKIGLAFCVGLAKEANIFIQILKKHGFDVESIICKVGSVGREIIGIDDCDVPMCNPIAQAKFLNDEKTEFNIVLGLC